MEKEQPRLTNNEKQGSQFYYHQKIKEGNNEDQQPEVPLWFNIVFYGGLVVLVVGAAFYFGLTVAAILLLIFSATFVGYLAEAYTPKFEVASFAKTVAISIGVVGIVMMFISEGWRWGAASLFGFWVLIVVSMLFWRKNITYKYEKDI